MVEGIPKVLIENKITPLLDKLRYSYSMLTRTGVIHGLIAVDQDAKILAIDGQFDKKLNFWDLSSIGAALYGVAKQGKDFFNADSLEKAALIYNNMQLFVMSIGDVQVQLNRRRDILIVVLADQDVKIGMILLQLNKSASNIKKEIESSGDIRKTLTLNEKEVKDQIKKMKKELISDKIGTLS